MTNPNQYYGGYPPYYNFQPVQQPPQLQGQYLQQQQQQQQYQQQQQQQQQQQFQQQQNLQHQQYQQQQHRQFQQQQYQQQQQYPPFQQQQRHQQAQQQHRQHQQAQQHPNHQQQYPNQHPNNQHQQYGYSQVPVSNPQAYYQQQNAMQFNTIPPNYGQPGPVHNYRVQNTPPIPQHQNVSQVHQHPAYLTPPNHPIPHQLISNDGADDTITVKPPDPEPLDLELPQPPLDLQEAQPPPRPPSPEYEMVLMSMADQYLNAAYAQASIATQTDEAALENYDKLIVTSLACMDAILRKWRLQPLLEAKVRLQYARLLIEETENNYEAESVLTRGIDLAKENRLWDLQYTMQVLLARLQFQLNPKVAIKAVDSIIDDVEAYQHISWIYVFRFLRMSFSSSSPSNAEQQASVHHLQKIQELARRYRDHAILVWAAAMEALIHLKGHSHECYDQAQRALAVARQMQLDDQLKASPQIQILVQLIDVCSSLQEWNYDQIQKKTLAMQQMMDTVVDDQAWLTDGSVSIPISKRSTAGLAALSDEIVGEVSGAPVITINWLTKQDVYAIGYLVSAVGIYHKNPTDGHKAEKFLREGLALIQKCLKKPELVHGSLAYTTSHANFRRTLECYFLLQQCYLLLARNKYDDALACLSSIHKISQILTQGLPLEIRCQVKYLNGAVHQSNGELDKALAAYQDDDLSLTTTSIKAPHSRTHFDTCLLAVMNTVLILRSPDHPLHYQLQEKLNWLSMFAPASYDKNISASYNLLLATIPNITHLQLKDHLSHSMKLAKEINNHQVTSLTLGMMSWKWFRGVVGDQAEKGALAMHATAKKSGSALWTSVADGMLSDTLERMGKTNEATKSLQEGLDLFHSLPEKVKTVVKQPPST